MPRFDDYEIRMLDILQRDGRKPVSELAQEIGLSTTPCALNPHYGFLWWLNTDGKKYPSAARDAFFASGAGGNLTWVDPSSGIVAVLRWTDPAAMDGFIGRVRAALTA